MTVDDIVEAHSDPCGLSLECITSEQFLTLGVNLVSYATALLVSLGASPVLTLPAFIPSFHNMNSSRKTYQ